jgi:hypothetical protein
LQGQVLKPAIADSEQAQLRLTSYQPGVYFIKIKIDGSNIFRKLILK